MKIVKENPYNKEALKLVYELSNELNVAEKHKGIKYYPIDMKCERSVFLIGKLNEQPIACGAIIKMDEDKCELNRLYVKKNFRGKGYSKKILTELEEYARKFNFKEIVINAHPELQTAICLYEQFGYSKCDNESNQFSKELCFQKVLDEEN